MPQINPKTGKPYPDTPAGRAASEAEYKSRQKTAARKTANAKATAFGAAKKRPSALKKKAWLKILTKRRGNSRWQLTKP